MIKEKWKGGRNRHNNSQYFTGKEWWIFSKMLAKDMHQILQTEFKNCTFSASPQTPPFFQWPKIYNA